MFYIHITSLHQVESDQGSRDDTTLNAIGLVCSDASGDHFKEASVTSTKGRFGHLTDYVVCRQHLSHEAPSYLTAFSLQVEPRVSDMINYLLITYSNFVKSKQTNAHNVHF